MHLPEAIDKAIKSGKESVQRKCNPGAKLDVTGGPGMYERKRRSIFIDKFNRILEIKEDIQFAIQDLIRQGKLANIASNPDKQLILYELVDIHKVRELLCLIYGILSEENNMDKPETLLYTNLKYDLHQVEDMYNHSMKAIQKSHDHNIGLNIEDYNVLVKILNYWREFNEQ